VPVHAVHPGAVVDNPAVARILPALVEKPLLYTAAGRLRRQSACCRRISHFMRTGAGQYGTRKLAGECLLLADLVGELLAASGKLLSCLTVSGLCRPGWNSGFDFRALILVAQQQSYAIDRARDCGLSYIVVSAWAA